MASASERFSQAGPSRLPLASSTHEIKAVQRRRSSASPTRRRARVAAVPALLCCAVAALLGAAPQRVYAQDTAAGLSSGSLPLIATTGSADSTAATAPPQRWGQASALVDSLFLVHGGKTQGTSPGQGGFTYASGPNSGELLALDLSQSFNPASPPWQSVNVTGDTLAPAVSFHSLAPLQAGSQRLLLFGGDATGTLPIQTGNDSAYTLQLGGAGSSRTATWTRGDAAWGEPMRRVYHSAESDAQGGVWIVGGQRDDGSSIMMDETWSFNASDASPAFTQVAPPTGSVVDGTVTRLSDGTLLLLGGLDQSGSAHSFNNILAYSPQRQSWAQTAAQGVNDSTAAFPAPRRSHIAVSLPDRRVFLHGGATADLSTAFADAWILDWSADTPYWTQVESPGAPTARYGHAAAAWGRQIVLSFGWSGGNAADTTAYVFDAIGMKALGNGAWSGGSWSSTYSPDPSAGVAPKDSGSNGSSSSTGSSSSGNGKNGSSTTKTFGSPTASSSDKPKSDSGPSAGVKAGAFLAAFIGVGLIAGGGYAVYRRRQTAPANWRHGEGAAGLLGGAGGRAYDDFDDAYMLEKGEGGGGGGLGAYEQGGRVMGPRPLGASPVTWTAGNIGHAMEGSGPHLRERIAMITGFGFGSSAAAGQARFDMLADEDDESAYRMSGKAGLGAGARAYRASATDPDDEPVDVAMRVRERSYGRLEQDDIEEEYSLGDIGGRGADDAAHFVRSPFEDEEDSHALGYGAAGGLLAVGAAAALPRSSFGSDAGRSDDNGSTPAPSAQSHTDSYATTGATSSIGKSSGEGAIVSFSDAAAGSRRGPTSPVGPRAAPSPAGMKRSPTWWNRFSFLERSASGRLLTGPTADEPIRDPARPPDLAAIRESPRSADTSEDNPFGDVNRTDDLGRIMDSAALAGAYRQHARSLSSLQSARTATSSQLETQLRNMDVVQRTRTASSRRTHSSTESEYESVGMVSRGPSTRRRATNDEGAVVWDQDDWAGAGVGVPTTVPEEDSFAGGAAMDMPTLQSGDPYALETPVLGAEPYKASPLAALRSRELHIRTEASEASITPATTKRARENPQLTAPRSPLPRHEPDAPLQGSVKDRVKALDRKHTALGDEAVLPIPRSPGAPSSAHSSSPEPSTRAKVSPLRIGSEPLHNPFADVDDSVQDARSPSPSRRALEASTERSKGTISPSGAATSKDKVRYTHGLVPKAQLFVANPDRSSSGSA